MSTPEGATPFQRLLGLRWSNGDDGAVIVDMDIRDDLRGPVGSLEGGVVSTLVDVAGASAAAVAMQAMVATADMTVHFLAPGRVGPVRATGVPLRIGSDNAVVEVKVIDTGKDDRLMATALLTIRALR
ncbi:MAG: PaaI family thioesterase [Actinomycetes bacterium]